MTLKTRKQIADETGLTVGYFAKLAVTGSGPPMVKLGRAVRYDPRDVQEWLDARRVGSTSEQVAA